jgi:hypothetical protein
LIIFYFHLSYPIDHDNGFVGSVGEFGLAEEVLPGVEVALDVLLVDSLGRVLEVLQVVLHLLLGNQPFLVELNQLLLPI